MQNQNCLVRALALRLGLRSGNFGLGAVVLARQADKLTGWRRLRRTQG